VFLWEFLNKKAITFSPPLPSYKQDVIDTLTMGHLEKVFLIFEEKSIFWPKDQYTFALVGENVGQKVHSPTIIINLYASHGYPILGLVAGGEAGIQITKRSLKENSDWLMSYLRSMWPEAKNREPIKVVTTNWTNDPFAYGSYVALPT